MKKYFIVALMVLLTAPSWAIAANDILLTQSVNIVYPGDGLTYTLYNGSTLDSFTVSSTNMTFTVSANSDFRLISADLKDFTVTYATEEGSANVVYSVSCSGSNSVLQVQGRSTAASSYTVTVVPEGTYYCSGGGGGGSTSGGGGGYTSPTPTTSSTEAGTLSSMDAKSSDGGSVSLLSSVFQSIGALGGTIALSDNSVSVSVPANAVNENVNFSLTPQLTFAQPKTGYGSVGSQSYSITATTASGVKVTQFNNQLTLTFNYTDNQIVNFDENTLVVSYWSETTGEWVDLPTSIDAANNRLTATTDHLTKFIVQAKVKNGAPYGSLIKTSSSSAVYYVGHDGNRYVFPDEKVYYSWYSDFKDVLTVSQATLLQYQLGGNITVRGGTKLVQFVAYDYSGNMIVDDPHVYAVSPGGVIRWVQTAEIAKTLYGDKWEQTIVPVSNNFFSNYAVGSTIATGTYPDGSLVNETSTGSLYYITGGQKRLVTAAGLTANGFQSKHYLSVANLNGYEATGALNDYQNSISWTGGK